MLSLEFWGAQKEPPEAQKQEFVLSLKFSGRKQAFWGSPGGRKEHFYHVFKQNLQKAQNGKSEPPGRLNWRRRGLGGTLGGGNLGSGPRNEGHLEDQCRSG